MVIRPRSEVKASKRAEQVFKLLSESYNIKMINNGNIINIIDLDTNDNNNNNKIDFDHLGNISIDLDKRNVKYRNLDWNLDEFSSIIWRATMENNLIDTMKIVGKPLNS